MSATLNSSVPVGRGPLRPAGAGAPTPARRHSHPLQAPGRDQTEAIAFARGVTAAFAIFLMVAGLALALFAGNVTGAHLAAVLLVAGGGFVLVRIAVLHREESPTEPTAPDGEAQLWIHITAAASRLTESLRAMAERIAPVPPAAADFLLERDVDELGQKMLARLACDGDQFARDRKAGLPGLRAVVRIDGAQVAS